MHYLIALKFGTLKSVIRPHPDAKFGCNTINSHKGINDHSQKLTPVQCVVMPGKKLKIGKKIG